MTTDRLAEHVSALARGGALEPFLDAARAVDAEDATALRVVLDRHPDLVRESGPDGNSLLNLAHGKPELMTLLLERGADPNHPDERGWTPLHQCGQSNDVAPVRMLLAAGGDVTIQAHGDGGTPLAAALIWGNREAAQFLAEVEITPNNLRIAAGLNRVDLLRAHLFEDGSLKPSAGAHRDFYRPNRAFPNWRPSEDPQEVLDEALVWAAKAGAIKAAAFLLEHGARMDADPYRGTPLTWAAFRNRPETLRWLLDHGAEANRQATFGGPSHGAGITALHLAAENSYLESCRILVECGGADPSIPDHLYHSPPWGWAEHFAHAEVRDYLLTIAAQADVFAAVVSGNEAQLRKLLEQGSPTLHRADYRLTPLAKAVEAGNVPFVELLLQAGADPDQAAAAGKTARDLASGHWPGQSGGASA